MVRFLFLCARVEIYGKMLGNICYTLSLLCREAAYFFDNVNQPTSTAKERKDFAINLNPTYSLNLMVPDVQIRSKKM